MLLLEFDAFAAETEKVEEPHFVDEFGGVVGVEQHLLAQLATLQVLRVVLSLLLIATLLSFCTLPVFIGVGLVGDSE